MLVQDEYGRIAFLPVPILYYYPQQPPSLWDVIQGASVLAGLAVSLRELSKR